MIKSRAFLSGSAIQLNFCHSAFVSSVRKHFVRTKMKKTGIIIFAAAVVVGVFGSLIAGGLVGSVLGMGAKSGSFCDLFSFKLGGTKGSGNIVNEHRDADDFHGVDVGGVFQVEIVRGDFAVEVTADDNLIPLISTEVDDGILKIETEGRLKPSSPMRLRISAPNIDSLNASGACNVDLSGVSNAALSIDVSGASKVKVTGETSKLTVDVSGASKIDAEALKAQEANIDASGTSHVDVNVSSQLTADASGASKVVYSGDPGIVHKDLGGGASVSPK